MRESFLFCYSAIPLFRFTGFTVSQVLTLRTICSHLGVSEVVAASLALTHLSIEHHLKYVMHNTLSCSIYVQPCIFEV